MLNLTQELIHNIETFAKRDLTKLSRFFTFVAHLGIGSHFLHIENR